MRTSKQFGVHTNIVLQKGMIFYTTNQLNLKIAHAVQKQLNIISKEKSIPIVSASLKPMSNMGHNIVLSGKPSYLKMFEQILAALEASTADVIFMTEHDVLYPKEHFEFTPPEKDKFYYDLNWYKVGKRDLAVHWDAVQVSGLVAYRNLLLDFYRSRVATFDPNNFDRKFEPTVDTEYETWWASKPHIDIRHDTNTTYNKWKLEHFRDKSTAINFKQTTIDKIKDWPNLSDILK